MCHFVSQIVLSLPQLSWPTSYSEAYADIVQVRYFHEDNSVSSDAQINTLQLEFTKLVY